MNAIIKEFKWKPLLRRIMRCQGASYSQYRHNHQFVAQKLFGSRATWSRTMPCLNQGLLTVQWMNGFKHPLQVAAYSSSSSMDAEDDDSVELGLDSVELDDTFTIEDDLSHIRIKLYQNDKDERLEKLCEAASVQQVLDIVENETEVDMRVASQALVTIWDLQKLLFKIGTNFDPERDYFNRPTFIEKIVRHPVFLEKIVKPIVENCESLEDEPLLASLFCLQRLNFDIKGPECSKLVDECLQRSETLSLPSLSRLCVCMRTESLYGNFIVAKFYPLLWKYIDSMKSDLEVRLVAITLRNSLRLVTDAMMDKFRTKIYELQNDIPNWESVTLCKVFLLLMTCRNEGTEFKEMFDVVGEALVSRVPTLQIIDLISLQKFLELGFLQPYDLIEALIKRMLRIVQEGISNSSVPRLDLLACIAPRLKTVPQRKQLLIILEDYLDKHNFEFASGILFTLLRWSNSKNVKVFDKFWDKAADLIVQREKEGMLDRKMLKLAKDYVSFCFGLGFGYRNRNYEFSMKRYIYKMIDNYSQCRYPSLLHPGDFAKAFSFLIGAASWNDAIFYELDLVRTLDDFAPQFRPADLAVMSRGLDSVVANLFYGKKPAPKYYDRMLEICSILDEQCGRILLCNTEEPSFTDMMALYKVALTTRKIKGDSPAVDQSMQRVLKCKITDSRAIKDLSAQILSGINNYPEASKIITDFMWDRRNTKLSPEIYERFIITAFALGWDVKPVDILELCSNNLAQDWEKLNYLSLLQASVALCYYGCLPKEMVQNIFSVEFLDHVDAELSTSYKGSQYPLKLRQTMMELNRAVCLDMPDVNLPWFHGKFCEEVLALTPNQETYLHQEVRSVLANIVGDDTAIQTNMISPYYYKLDFLVEFDKKDRPIRKQQSKPSSFFRRSKTDAVEVKRKVAVLLLNPSAFTRNIRGLRGSYKLRRRHLEILGYHVIEIDPMYWNSMFMSENSVKHNFLESKLYANAG